MTTFLIILISGLLMAAIALAGSLTLLFPPRVLEKILLPLVSLAAGSLIGGAFFHMIPAAINELDNTLLVFLLLAAGFTAFMALEQFMHWQHCYKKNTGTGAPVTVLILIADGLHNFIGGLTVGSVFMVDIRLGISTWIAAAAHEIPQELGDFGVLVHGGWKKKKALFLNFLSGLTFLIGSLTAYILSKDFQLNTGWLIPFGAGNFLYIAASDLIPQVTKEKSAGKNLWHFLAFITGLGILFLLA